jgi:hypothetical protein
VSEQASVWGDEIPATVFGFLQPGVLRVVVLPGYGMGNIPWDIPLDVVPPDLRLPNTKVWLQLNKDKAVLRVRGRTQLVGQETT